MNDLTALSNLPSVEFAAWMASATFTLGFALLVHRAVQVLRGAEPQPPNAALGRDVKDLRRRVELLEEWRHELIQKLDSDKQEILRQGEERSEKIYAHIERVRRELAENQINMPDRIVAMLRNLENK